LDTPSLMEARIPSLLRSDTLIPTDQAYQAAAVAKQPGYGGQHLVHPYKLSYRISRR
jgi:hypothetical protein